MTVMTASALPLARIGAGKVRDIYAVDAERLLLVATDRVSAFDVVMREAMPYKGAVLTQISAWWFRQLGGRRAASSDLGRTPPTIVRAVPALAGHRGSICAAARCSAGGPTVFPVECVVRGYISGSAWKEYADAGTLAGEPLRRGCARATS